MDADFEIALKPALRKVRLTLNGFFTPQDVARLGAAIRAEYPKLGCGPNNHRTLLDLRGLDIQSQETLRVFGLLLNDPDYQGERLAILFSHTLVRMQISRVAAKRAATMFFDNIEAAQAWLAEQGPLADWQPSAPEWGGQARHTASARSAR